MVGFHRVVAPLYEPDLSVHKLEKIDFLVHPSCI